MESIKLYKELTAIETFDGIIYSTISPEEIDKAINNVKFMKFGDDRIAVHQIKKYGPKTIDTIESHILSKPKDIQTRLLKRQEDKKRMVGRGFDSIKEIENYLQRN